MFNSLGLSPFIPKTIVRPRRLVIVGFVVENHIFPFREPDNARIFVDTTFALRHSKLAPNNRSLDFLELWRFNLLRKTYVYFCLFVWDWGLGWVEVKWKEVG